MAQEIKNALKLLKELQKLDPEFPLQYAICLFEISLNEGLSVSELARRTNLSLSTVSRIVGALSKHRQKGAPFQLVTAKIAQTERRRKEIYLTTRGKAVLQGIRDLAA